MRIFVFTFLNCWFLANALFAQEPIKLNNPSFEDMPRHSKAPGGWYDCGFPGESPPDVQPSQSESESIFSVRQIAQNGNTYLGMVVRDNDTWEMVGQRLASPLEKGQCYEFSLALCRSEYYVSQSRLTNEAVNYTTPIKLRIWGGHGDCGKSELLAETPLVINTRWLEYNFKFEPKRNHTYILLEAFFKTPTLFPYNGNVLVDNASEIIPIPCSTEVPEIPMELPIPEEPAEEPVALNNPTVPVPKTPVTQPAEPVVETSEPIAAIPPKDRILKDLDRKTIQKGQTIRIDKLYFAPDQVKPSDDSYEVLDEVYDFLSANADMVVEIGGHTNTIPSHEYCDRLSTNRAKSVVDYLIRRGIAETRLQYKGYGKRQPLFRNDKTVKANRVKNQRVEIKVLSFDS